MLDMSDILKPLRLNFQMRGFNSFTIKNSELIPLEIERCNYCLTEMITEDGKPIKYLRTDMKKLAERINKKYIDLDITSKCTFYDGLCDDCYSESRDIFMS